MDVSTRLFSRSDILVEIQNIGWNYLDQKKIDNFPSRRASMCLEMMPWRKYDTCGEPDKNVRIIRPQK